MKIFYISILFLIFICIGAVSASQDANATSTINVENMDVNQITSVYVSHNTDTPVGAENVNANTNFVENNAANVELENKELMNSLYIKNDVKTDEEIKELLEYSNISFSRNGSSISFNFTITADHLMPVSSVQIRLLHYWVEHRLFPNDDGGWTVSIEHWDELRADVIPILFPKLLVPLFVPIALPVNQTTITYACDCIGLANYMEINILNDPLHYIKQKFYWGDPEKTGLLILFRLD